MLQNRVFTVDSAPLLLQITDYRRQITDCRLQIADYRLQIVVVGLTREKIDFRVFANLATTFHM